MNQSQKSRILWLVRCLTAMGLVMVAITSTLVGWTLSRVRQERAQATTEQERLTQASRALSERAVDSRVEVQSLLDETTGVTNGVYAVNFLTEFVRAQASTKLDLAGGQALQDLHAAVGELVQLRDEALRWRGDYLPLWEDWRLQKTMGQARTLIGKLRGDVEQLEGQHRLAQAISFRRWRRAQGDEAHRLAQSILLEQARAQSEDASDLRNQIAELARLVEALGGEEQFDNLVDLKDNKLKPALDRLTRSFAGLSKGTAETLSLTPRSVEDVRRVIFGEGYASNDAHQNVQAGNGGLYALRRGILRLRREREKLKNEEAVLFQRIELGNMRFAQSAQARHAVLTQQMESSLESGWRRVLILSGCCVLSFLWLAWLISRGIRAQVKALDEARDEARAKHAELQAVNDSSPLGMSRGDANGHCVYANKVLTGIVGLTAEEMALDGWRKALHPDDRDRVVQQWEDAVARHADFVCVHRFLHADGRVVWASVKAAPISREQARLGYVATVEDITERKQAEEELARTQQKLVETSRMAGMAEVATGVLHNVGNVLNSVNVSASMLIGALKKSKAPNLGKVVVLLKENEGDLGTFLTADAKGRQVPAFLSALSETLVAEQAAQLSELGALQRNVDHIKDIVAMQQTYAKVTAVMETVRLQDLLEDTLRMNATALTKHDVRVVREFEDLPPVEVDKHKLLQILVNLVRNAKHACGDSGREDRQIVLRLVRHGDRIRITVADNGVGIAPENLNRIFHHGFTTKKDGHGFGLHSSANAAREMGGALTVESHGPGTGATFIVDLPASFNPRGVEAPPLAA